MEAVQQGVNEVLQPTSQSVGKTTGLEVKCKRFQVYLLHLL